MNPASKLDPRITWPRAYNERAMWARLRQHHLLVPLLVLLLGASAATLTWVTTSRNEGLQRQRAYQEVAQRHARRVEAVIEQYIDLLRNVRALFALRGDVSEGEFVQFVGEVMPTVDGVPRSSMMFVRVEDDGAFVETIVPAAHRARWSGVDLAGISRVDAAFERALTEADISISAPAPLPRADGSPGEPGLLLVVPVFGVRPVPTDLDARRAVLNGYLVDAVPAGALLDEAFGSGQGLLDARDDEITLTDVSAASPDGLSFATYGASPAMSSLRGSDTIYPGDRTWTVDARRVTPDRVTVNEFLQRPSTTLSASIFLVVTLCAHIVYALTRQKSLVQQEVRARTAELRQKNLLLQRQEQELAEVNLKLLEQSHTDPLTEILNRRGFEEQLEQERQRTGRTGVPYGLLIFDVDNFKAYNDHYGHIAGDEVLKRVAHIIYGEARRIDCVARYGGEEFVILASGTDAVGLLALGERVRERIQEAAIPNEKTSLGVVTVSGGGALSKVDAEHDPKPVLEIADRCLYEAKATGKNRVVMRM